MSEGMSLVTGNIGQPGPIGRTGQVGASGDTGGPGFPGPIGLVGAQGWTGQPGQAGVDGQPGAKGITGPAGFTGKRFLTMLMCILPSRVKPCIKLDQPVKSKCKCMRRLFSRILSSAYCECGCS